LFVLSQVLMLSKPSVKMVSWVTFEEKFRK
jgi:hypothetical protein